ncbi:MAG: ThuA domain-containing protein [Candidatus Solibacter usitatus]|nr:ThuA domain-containing protein [Candidatus Solibacter usitatus]
MKVIRIASLTLIGLGLCAPVNHTLQAQAPKKRLLIIGAVKGFQHDATSQGMATLWKLGKETGLWDAYIKTDAQLLTKKKLTGNAKNIDYFDAVAFYTTGELDMDDEQKAALMSFIKDDGKGFIGVHSAPDTFYKWPEYGEMLGGWFDGHPWNTFQAPIIIEDQANPIVKHLGKEMVVLDEIYQAKEFSREKCRVLMRLDESKLDLTKKGIKRTDKDWAVSWIKSYGKGRVFYSTLGHTPESWDRPDVQQMWLEAVKWTMGLTQADATPRPRPAQ